MPRVPPPLRFPWLAAPVGRVGRRRVPAHSTVARMATTAVRIPDPRVTPLQLRFVPIGPQIFVHEGARQILERRFEAAFGGTVQLSVTDNRHRMITHRRARSALRVRLHMMFLGAPERIVEALVRWVVEGDRDASLTVGRYIDANMHRIRASRPVSGPIRSRGSVHDLSSVLEHVNTRYFGGSISDVLITWGRRTRPRDKQRTTIKLGSYSAVERLIRVHPSLDNRWVPRYFLSYIVYHELLHHLIPAIESCGRAVLHSSEFGEREREFRHYERALAWEKLHIDRLLRAG